MLLSKNILIAKRLSKTRYYNFEFVIGYGKNASLFAKKIILQNSTMTKKEKNNGLLQIFVCLLFGVFVGFLNGFFGGGGGMIVVPILTFFLHLQDKQSHATAILTILPISVASSIIYLLNNTVNFFDLGFSSLGFVVGGVIGAFALKKLNNKFIKILFALVMIFAGIKMLI